jgi:hypothetical protein
VGSTWPRSVVGLGSPRRPKTYDNMPRGRWKELGGKCLQRALPAVSDELRWPAVLACDGGWSADPLVPP